MQPYMLRPPNEGRPSAAAQPGPGAPRTRAQTRLEERACSSGPPRPAARRHGLLQTPAWECHATSRVRRRPQAASAASRQRLEPLQAQEHFQHPRAPTPAGLRVTTPVSQDTPPTTTALGPSRDWHRTGVKVCVGGGRTRGARSCGTPVGPTRGRPRTSPFCSSAWSAFPHAELFPVADGTIPA
jgi:hypothetical protein